LNKILVLNGSPRGKNGNTEILVDKFLEGYLNINSSTTVDYIELRKFEVKSCIGCFNCWRKTPGKCIHKDDMEELMELYLAADTIIWATPLYHHGMTSILKTFVERTLPVSQPYIVENNGKFTHPERWDISGKKNILISNCGFPEHQNFDIMTQSFNRIASGGIDESILCVMGELLSKKPLQSIIQWYLDSVEKSGVEFAKSSEFSMETRSTLGTPLVPIEKFIEMANLSWEAEGEMPPSYEEAMGLAERTYSSSTQNHLKGLSQLKLMKHSFNKENAKGYDSILEIEFTDIQEIYHFIIKDQSCELVEGKSNSYTTKIATPYDIWLQISNGELEGSQAMMDGLYKVKGDMNLLMKMRTLFGGESIDHSIPSTTIENERILGIHGNRWMSISFIPWIMSWVSIGFNGIWGIWLPLVMSTFIAGLKWEHHEVTYFEKASVLYFSLLGIIQLVGLPIVSHQGVILNYFSIAIIWGVSLIDGRSLTSDYSKYEVEGNMSENALFKKTNENLTFFWSIMFTVQGILFITLNSQGLTRFAPCLYILTIAALKFTKWYSAWYPQKIMQG